MDENKNLNEIAEDVAEEITAPVTETAQPEEVVTDEKPAEETAAAPAEEKAGEPKKEKKPKKEKAPRAPKVRNKALFKRGGYAVAITALVLAVLILFNWLVGVLAQRFHLDFDMSAEKVNTISEENLDYIKKIDKDVQIIVCSSEENYVEYVNYFGQNLYQATGDNASDYYEQTLKLVNRYAEYNKKINVRFIDPQTPEFAEISSKYSSDKLAYGDIIVSATNAAGVERHKKIGFTDIYALSDENGYAAYGYGGYTVSGNNIETALTGAIAYAVSSETKRVAFLTGHSKNDATAGYQQLLKDNNYEVSVVSDQIIASIDPSVDLLVLAAPTSDFMKSELDLIADFLDNDSKLGKGLIFFGDATAPALPNLYDFLAQWGFKVNAGILYETDKNNHMEGDPMTMGMFPNQENEDTAEMAYCISGYNVPILETKPADAGIQIQPIFTTSDTVAAAPVGASATWNGYKKSDLGSFLSAAEAYKLDYDDDNKEIRSYVVAFSSVEYIASDWIEYTQLSNKDVSLLCADHAANVSDAGISFVSKTITSESFASDVTASSVTVMRIIFMVALPVLTLAAGIIIFIRRRNA